MAKNWIKGAIKHPGAFSKKAKAAGESTAEFAKKEADAPGKTGQQARLAQTLMHMGHKPEMSKASHYVGKGK